MIDKNGGCEDSHCRFFMTDILIRHPSGRCYATLKNVPDVFFIGTVVGAGVNDGHEKTKAVSLMKKNRR
ncbi:hypothetical protein [Pectobacterium brasiliense]|uniref:hypothetical protein n=1 Tax=Pectobacterium brasiliense TaxID=180957 RepID=UPI003987B272